MIDSCIFIFILVFVFGDPRCSAVTRARDKSLRGILLPRVPAWELRAKFQIPTSGSIPLDNKPKKDTAIHNEKCSNTAAA